MFLFSRFFSPLISVHEDFSEWHFRGERLPSFAAPGEAVSCVAPHSHEMIQTPTRHRDMLQTVAIAAHAAGAHAGSETAKNPYPADVRVVSRQRPASLVARPFFGFGNVSTGQRAAVEALLSTRAGRPHTLRAWRRPRAPRRICSCISASPSFSFALMAAETSFFFVQPPMGAASVAAISRDAASGGRAFSPSSARSVEQRAFLGPQETGNLLPINARMAPPALPLAVVPRLPSLLACASRGAVADRPDSGAQHGRRCRTS